jgi:hypothetical protein
MFVMMTLLDRITYKTLLSATGQNLQHNRLLSVP